jgi:rhomboid family GlyGly-CTERM serine protease
MKEVVPMHTASTDCTGYFCFIGGLMTAVRRHWNRLKGRLDMLVLLAAVVVFNAHLVGLGSGTWALFLPAAVEDGQWWRLFTHPFVHVTWYHLLLDAGAFFLLYDGLEEKRMARKLLLLPICAVGGLLAALAFSPLVDTAGLCGLSGTAHGLMAFSGLEMMRTPGRRGTGAVFFTLVTAKSLYELATGRVFFDFLHMGLCGAPVAACHFGGVAGGTVVFLLFSALSRRSAIERNRYFVGA